MTASVAIHWFRQDLRLTDNPALTAASKGRRVLPIFILDEENSGENASGSSSRWWLKHSLESLDSSLNGNLSVYCGDPLPILKRLISRFKVEALFWNRCYEPWRIKRDEKIKEEIKTLGIEARSLNGSLLWEPWEVIKKDGTPYKVFTPYYRKGCLQAHEPRKSLEAPDSLDCLSDEDASLQIKAPLLFPRRLWHEKLEAHWKIGEQAAMERLQKFLNEGLAHYQEGRNLPDRPFVSRLSAHLHFGEISPNQIWHALPDKFEDKNIDCFRSELGWREFSHHLLYHNPDMPEKNLQQKFDHFPWTEDAVALKAWQQGITGVPMVDAAMRELWQTGYMHNRARMIAGSFLVKNLRLDWRLGERWFWDTLVDADLANNSASWQWVAGCGADAAPYFRIFNPVTQGQKFDPEGNYVRKYLPEIASLPDRYLFCPWEAPESVLDSAGIELGITYPKPIVNLSTSRKAALEAFQSLKPGF